MSEPFASPIAHTLFYIPASSTVVRAHSRRRIRLDTGSIMTTGESLEALLIPADNALKSDPHYIINGAGPDTWIDLNFEGEQEYVLTVYREGERVASCCFYALEDDLFERLPMKADFHMHSTRSDGNVAPERIPPMCRMAGLDLMALTDHGLYEPSLNMIEYWKDYHLDMILCPGEEVHAPGNPVHIVNLAGKRSVNGLFRRDEDAYRLEVEAILPSLAGTALNKWERFGTASSIWVAERIKECGGLAVFCHPYWMWLERGEAIMDAPNVTGKYITDGIEDAIWSSGAFDCVELVGGFYLIENHYDANLRSIISFYEHEKKGLRLSPVGTSDCHIWDRDQRMGWYYTLCFARDWSAQGFLDAVREGYSLGVENYVTRATGPRAWGERRLARYAQFLFRTLYPRHDALCAQEGEWMERAARGDKEAADKLAATDERVKKSITGLFAKDWEGKP